MAGGNLLSNANQIFTVAQRPTYFVWNGIMHWDTIGAGIHEWATFLQYGTWRSDTGYELQLTLARTGGVGAPPPLRFFADSEKTAALRAAGFWATLWGKPCAIFGKKN